MATIFSVNKPRKFHRESYFHDERKERLEARIRKVKREMGMLEDEEYKPEDTIRGSFISGTSHLLRRKESDELKGTDKNKRYVKLAVWAIILGILLYLLITGKL
ncbi:MAG: hypothetical protein HUJ97_06390 [Bacteroidales bacterium]|nr:hypothetical protein [Bacteroidales bacterium]